MSKVHSDIIEHNEKHPHLNIEKNNPDSKFPKVVLVGNPNVGKSLFFNYLSGVYVDVSNFPGTTVSITKGIYKKYSIYDTPGIYGVSSFNDEEKVALDIILDADIILNVVNSLHLERDIFLTQQLIEMGKKVTVILNFFDEVEKRKIKIKPDRLSELLGVEVITTSAIKKSGFDRLDFAIENARIGNQPKELHHILHETLNRVGSQAEALMILEGDTLVAERHGVQCGSPDEREIIYIERRNRVNEIVSEVEYEDSSRGKFLNLLGRLSLNPLSGIPILIIVLTILYFFIGDFVAQRVVNFTENTIGKGYVEYYMKSYIAKFTPSQISVNLLNGGDKVIETKNFIFDKSIDSDLSLYNEFKNYSRLPNAEVDFSFNNLLVRLFFGEFGIISMTVTYLIFLLLPLVIAFYFAMAMLEDSGYLPRLATMLDRVMTKIGLNGRAVIPIMLGFGCVTMATITTRLLGSEREKTIATAILQFVIPCSAQLAVIAVLMSSAGIAALLIYVSVIFIVLILLSTTLNKFLPGESTSLLIDLPMMRFPELDNVFKKTFFRTYGFMKEASLWFFVGALFVGLLDVTGMLLLFQDILAPITTIWLKLPKEAATAFVMGVVRRDFGAAGLFNLSLTSMQITVALITITLFVPCIASFMVMLNERGWKEGISIWLGTWFFAFLIGGIVAQIIL
ncbi:MAG: ferrous iron transporter B [Ignavibacteria bacterium]|jgi:ferrous iron transport protein B|nr:ferrous iron transporter B [Ignavibacteria bacterium]